MTNKRSCSSLPGFVPRRRKKNHVFRGLKRGEARLMNVLFSYPVVPRRRKKNHVFRGLKRGEARLMNVLFSLFLLGHCVELYQANKKICYILLNR